MRASTRVLPAVLLIILTVLSQFSTPKSVSAACGGTVYVDKDSAAPSPTGCTWALAFPTLQDALTLGTLVSGDQIWVADGTYYPDQGAGQTNNARTSTFTLVNGVRIYGGFNGTEGSLAARNPAVNVTILSGDIDGAAGNANNAYHVISGFNLSNATVLDGFTIRDGNDNSGSGLGGGIYLSDSSPTFANLIITNNAVTSNGGGIFITTVNNTVPEASYSRPSFTDVTFSNNTAGRGGGLYAQNSSPSLTRVVFSGNVANNGAGGGMNVQVFAITDARNRPSLTDVTFSGNTATGGGGFFNTYSDSTLLRVTFSGNTATRRGGAILNEFSSPTLTNVTISGNTSNNVGADPRGGGGIMNIASNPTLNNVTFNGNTSTANGITGGAIRTVKDPLGPTLSNVIIRNSILWGDSTEIVSDGTGTVTVSDSVVQGGFAGGTNILTANPNLGALANNGGFTSTMAISAGSSALDAGGVTTACAATDQRGLSRPQGTACDVGAFEFGGTSTTTAAGSAVATYGDASVNVTATVSPNPGGGSVQFFVNGNPVGSATVNAGTGVATLSYNPSALTVGSYPIRADFLGSGNFLSSTSNPGSNGTLTINQKTASVTPSAASKNYGDADPVLTGTLVGFLLADNVTAAYSRTAGESVAGSPYTISATLSPLGVLGNYNITYNTANFTIAQRPASVTPDTLSKIYGDADPVLTGTLTGFLPADNVTATYSRTAGETVAGGPYTVSASLNPAGVLANYNITYNTANFTITQRPASVTPNAASKVYGDADPALNGTLTGFLPADNVTAIYSRAAGETVAGSPYTISANLSPAGVLGNYNITYNTADFTITTRNASVTPNNATKIYGDADPALLTTGTLTGFLPADNVTATYSRVAGETVAGSPYTISANLNPVGVLGNYNITYNTADFTITARNASVTPNNATKVYGDADPALLTTGTLTGFLPADNVTAAYSRGAGETVAGSPYTISANLNPAGVLGNYNITYNTANFTITQRPASVTPNNAGKTFGDADPAPLTTGTLTGFLPADNVTASYSRVAGESVAGSPYTISATLNPAGVLANYSITYNTADFTIGTRSASVTPDNLSKAYGDADPVLTGTLTGFLPADNVTATYTRVAGETVAGSPYTISASISPAGVLANYNITYNTGTLTITQRPASVTPNAASKIYGNADPALTGTLTGFLPADNVTATYSRVAGEMVAGSPYTISATLNPAGVLGNYNITYNTANFVITARNASVTPNAASKIYGASDPIFTGTLTGFLPADNVTAAYSRVAGETVAGSPYTINATLNPAGVLGNYNITSNTADFNITAVALTPSITANDKVYDGLTSATFTCSLTGVLGTDTVNCAGGSASFANKNVGINKLVTATGLSLSGADASNYTLSPTTATDTADITALPITVTSVTDTKVFDGNTSSIGLPTVSGNPIATGDTPAFTQTFDTPLVGTNKTLTPAGSVNDGNGGLNYTVTFVSVNTGTITGVPVTVTINQAPAQADPTRNSPITFRAVFSTTVNNFVTGDVTLAGTAGATSAVVTGSGTTYTITVSGMTGDGTVVASIPAGVASDSSGNLNSASTSTDNTVTYDTTAPTVTVEQAAGQADPTNTSPINFTVTFNEPVSGFAAGDVQLSGTAGASTKVVTGGPAVYNVAVSGMTANGTVFASINAGAVTDAAGNTSTASTSADNNVTYDTTGPVVTIGTPAPSTTTAGPVDFAVTITGATTVNLTAGDVTLTTTNTAAATTVTITNGNTLNPTITVSGVSGTGTIRITIAAGIASDAVGNDSAAAGPSAPFIVDNAGPIVLFNTNTVPADGATVAGGPTQLKVAFNENVKNDGSAGAANNPVNYLLVENGPNTTLDTVSCLLGAQGDDILYAVNSATYSNNGGSGPFVATLAVNGGTPLPIGSYHLFVCGTTSIEDLTNNELNDGAADTVIDFTVVQATTVVPKTGFAMNTLTNLPAQPAGLAYSSTDMWIEIPSLSVKMTVVGVPKTSAGWDVTWLGSQAGWLEGSAYPTWSGNSVLTAHVWDALNKPGPFARLKELRYGDRVKVHAFGQVYIYEVRETVSILPGDAKSMLKHQDKPWLTLITCEGFQSTAQEYNSRRMVRAVLVSVTTEK